MDEIAEKIYSILEQSSNPLSTDFIAMRIDIERKEARRKLRELITERGIYRERRDGRMVWSDEPIQD